MDIKPGRKRPPVQMSRKPSTPPAARQQVVGGVRRAPARQVARTPAPARPQFRDEVDRIEDDILTETAEAVKQATKKAHQKTTAERILGWVYRILGLVVVLAILAGLYLIYQTERSGQEQLNKRLDQIEKQL